MKYQTINEANALKDWKGSIVEATGLADERVNENKLSWMSTMMAINHRIENVGQDIHESYGSQAPGDFGTMGPVAWPSDPGTGVGAQDGAFFRADYKRGSGDIPSAKLAIAMNVAAYTIGLDLLPVVPMEFPSMMYSYLDHLYADGNLDNADALPTYLEISGTNLGTANFDYSLFTKGEYIYIAQADVNDAGTADAFGAALALQAKYYGKHRISGNIIVQLVATGSTAADGVFTADTTSSVSDVTSAAFAAPADRWVAVTGDAAGTTALAGSPLKLVGATEIGTIVKATLVNSMDEHIPEFSNPAATLSVNGPDRYSATRAQGELGTTNSISLQMFSTSVEAGTVEVIANITKNQLKDLKVYGIDGMTQIYKAAQNELTQTINRDVLRTMFRLGVTSHANLKAAQGLDLNLFVADGGTASEDLANFGLSEFVDITGVDRTGDFTAVPNGETNSSAENLYTRQRRIASKILAASNMISTASRYGRGDFAVVNTQVASALMDVKNFNTASFDNTLTVNNRNLYFIGSIQGGVNIYCDPMMGWSDTRVLIGRKGAIDDPGLKFFVYQLAESIETISETSMSPKIAVTSRYSLVPAGFYPESNYLTIGLATGFSSWV